MKRIFRGRSRSQSPRSLHVRSLSLDSEKEVFPVGSLSAPVPVRPLVPVWMGLRMSSFAVIIMRVVPIM